MRAYWYDNIEVSESKTNPAYHAIYIVSRS
jgi:hypothetical protein